MANRSNQRQRSKTIKRDQIIFRVAWCRDKGACRGADYVAATEVVWKLMACLTLFALANFLKALATKLLSSAFYRTAHFRKVKEALDKVRRV